MQNLDKIAQLLALTNSLGANDFRDSQATAMQLSAAQNAAAFPLELLQQQQQLSAFPQQQAADLAYRRSVTDAQKLENARGAEQALMGGLRGPLEAQGFDFSGFPQPVSPEQAVQAFQLATQGQQFPPDLANALRYDPRIGQLMLGLQQQFQQ